MKPHRTSLPTEQEIPDSNLVITEFFSKFWFCLALSIPILLFSLDLQAWFDYTIDISARQYLLLVWSSILYVYGGWSFVSGMMNELKKQQPGRQTFYAVASTIAFLYNLGLFFNVLPGVELFWFMTLLIDGLLLFNYLEMKVQSDTSHAQELFLDIVPTNVR
jgi:Cu2+-exporting ATPase